MSEHEHDWTLRGDKADPWVECWTCGEVRNGWVDTSKPAPHLSTNPATDDEVTP